MKRPMSIIGFIYILALAALQTASGENLILALVISALISLILIASPTFRKNKVMILSAVTITFAAGISLANFKINIEPVQKYDEQEKIISGIIDDLPYEKNGSLHYKMKIDHVGDKEVKPFSVMISSGTPLECDFGDRFYCTAHFYIPKSSYFFDSKQYYHSRGIYINAYIKNQNETYTVKNAGGGIKYQITKLRAKMLEASKNFFTEEIGDIQNGIFLGERSSIQNSQRIIFLKTGIYHLICTSGIHISIVMASFLWLFKKLKLGQRLSHLLAMVPLFTFILLTGFSLSAIRAGLMCAVYLLGMALSKKTDSLNSLGLAVFLICFANPGSALSLGLWLSALSILGITLFNEKIFSFFIGKLSKKMSNNLLIKFLISVVSLSVSASIFTAPITILYSKIFSVTAIFTNIIFIPLTTIILVSAMALSVLWVFGTPKLIMYPFAFVGGMSVKTFIKLSEFFAKIPFSYISLDYPFIKFWIGITILTVTICLMLFNRTKAFVFSAIISIGALVCGIFSYQILNFNLAQITLINGGESVACIIRKNGHTACISCFGENNYTKNFENFLECTNIDDIDYFAITSSENLPDQFIKTTTRNHKTNCFILPFQSSYHISSDKIGVKPIYFGKELHSSLWGEDLKIDSFEINNCTYTKMTIDGKTNILIIPGGGNASDIPENAQSCDIILSYGIPKNFDKIKPKIVIVYGPQNIVSKDVPKFPPNVKIYNLAYYGKINITEKNNKHRIGV